MLNSTFLVQAIHFFIAYCIIERLLFRPALREINADKLVKKNLKDAVDVQDNLVRTLELSQEKAQEQVAKQLELTQPPLKTMINVSVPQEIPIIPHLVQDQKTKIINECVAALLKEVEHVH